MNRPSGEQPVRGPYPPIPGESVSGSGEGAKTALEAMLRKRMQAQTPDTSDLAGPQKKGS